MDLQENKVPAAKQVYKRFFFEPHEGLRVLFVGNSITHHDPKPDIGWDLDCGMAASCLENDYVHVVKKYILDTVPNASVGICHVSDFEREFLTMNDLKKEFEGAVEFKPNLVIMFFGANVAWKWAEEVGFENATVIFGEAYERFRNTLAGDRDVDFFHVQGFYNKPYLDKSKEIVAEKYGDTYVLLGDDIRFNTEYRGLYNHPNDAGMKAIADCLWEKIRQTVEEYR